MPLPWTFWLGLAFAAIGVVNSGLAAWLWTFPMVPDPGGPDPNGRSTAPRGWTMLHRVLGCVFIAIYLVMLWEMVPRLWRYTEGWDSGVVVHAALGLAVGPVVLVKVLVIRRFQRFGKNLPWLGGTLCALALVVVGLVAAPAGRLLVGGRWSDVPSAALPTSSPATLAEGRRAVIDSCLQCHGPHQVLEDRREPHDWEKIVEDMQAKARASPSRRQIPDESRASIAAYLSAIAGERDDHGDDGSGDDERGGRRRRGRGGRGD